MNQVVFSKIVSCVLGGFLVACIAGCVVIGKVENMNNKGQCFTSRSAQDATNCVSGMEGGGTVTPQTSVTPK